MFTIFVINLIFKDKTTEAYHHGEGNFPRSHSWWATQSPFLPHLPNSKVHAHNCFRKWLILKEYPTDTIN